MTPLHRHQLVLLGDDGWDRVRSRQWDAQARDCLSHWATQRLPLVVTRRTSADHDPELMALGLAAPARWQRRRIALTVDRRDIVRYDEFPLAAKLAPVLPPPLRAPWQRLCEALVALGATTRVYGSHGWQLLTGLDHVHAHSDIDLWAAVGSLHVADAVAAELDRYALPNAPRVDGELVFPDGQAFAWREWGAWRAGRCQAILAKTLSGASLITAADPAVNPFAGPTPAVAW